METDIRTTRMGRPKLSIPLPPKFDATAAVEQDFLTPPIWVASNPPPMFERPAEMKRTVSDISNWGGDDEDEENQSSSWAEVDKENVTEEMATRPSLHERRSHTFSSSRPKAPTRPSYKRRISDSVATRTRARLLAHQAFSSTVTPADEQAVPEPVKPVVKGERKPIITASALTILTLARSSSNPYSPPVDHDKFASAGLPLASPFHEKKSFLDGGHVGADETIRSYFGVSKSSKKDK